ncbi:MAG TPA: Rieske (2Fe-2S) protein [Halobacteriales archaeon]|nr:Rieske (2Fe-2S) protein [Halobacteriales archaeon]
MAGDDADSRDATQGTDVGDGHVVASVDELADGDRLVAQLEGREVAVFRHDGEFYAYLNWCFHQGGPCCEGVLSGTAFATYDRGTGETDLRWDREGEILNCPWHGWEYDLLTGECLSRKGASLPAYPVEVRDGDVVVTM